MKKYLLVLFFSSSLFSDAQVTYQEKLGTVRNETCTRIISFADSSCVLTGEANGGLVLARIDYSGNILWIKNYYDAGIISIKKTHNNNFILAIGEGQYFYRMIEIDLDGNILWSNYSSFSQFNYGVGDIIETTDRGFLFTTWIYDSISKNILIKFDSLGNYLWSKTFFLNNGNNNVGSAVLAQLDNGGFLYSGFNYNNGSSWIHTRFILKLDSAGNILQSHQLLLDGDEIYQYNGSITFHSLSSNSFIALTAGTILTCFDSTGMIKWEKTFSNSFWSRTSLMMNDGRIALSGNSGSWLRPTTVITDSLGNILQSQIDSGYQIDTNRILSMSVMPDGGIIKAGCVINVTTDSLDICLIKTDSNFRSGCNEYATNIYDSLIFDSIAPLSITTNILTLNFQNGALSDSAIILSRDIICYNFTSSYEISSTDYQFEISPNPATATITLKNISLSRSSQLQIVNVLGEILYTEKLTGRNEYTIRPNLSAGIYFVRMSDEKKSVTQKLIVE